MHKTQVQKRNKSRPMHIEAKQLQHQSLEQKKVYLGHGIVAPALKPLNSQKSFSKALF